MISLFNVLLALSFLLIGANYALHGGVHAQTQGITALVALALLTASAWIAEAKVKGNDLVILLASWGGALVLIWISVMVNKTEADAVHAPLVWISALCFFLIAVKIARLRSVTSSSYIIAGTGFALFASLFFLLEAPLGLPRLNPNHRAGAILAVALFPFIGALESRGQKQQFFALSFVLALGAIVLSHSRAVLFILACALALCAWWTREKRSAIPLKIQRIALIAVATVLVLGSVWTFFLASESWSKSLSLRLHIWKTTFTIIVDAPWFGVGWGNFESAFLQHTSAFSTFETAWHAHNDFLQLVAESGLLPLFPIGFLILTGIQFFRKNKARKQSLLLVSGLGVACLVMQSLVDFPFHIPSNLYLASLLLGFAVGSAYPTEASPTKTVPESAKSATLLLTAAGVMIALLLSATVPFASKNRENIYTIKFAERVKQHRQLDSIRKTDRLTDKLQWLSFFHTLFPSQSEATLMLSQTHEELGHLDEAERLLLALRASDPANSLIDEIIGDFYLRQRSWTPCLQAYQRVVHASPERLAPLLEKLFKEMPDPLLLQTIVPSSTPYRLLWIEKLIREGHSAVAIAELEKLTRDDHICDPRVAAMLSALSGKGEVHDQDIVGLLHNAGKHCQEINPATAQRLFGLVDYRKKRWVLAFEHFENSLLADPNGTEVLPLVSQVLRSKPSLRIDWSIRLDRILKEHAHDPTLLFAKAMLEKEMGNWQDAVERLKSLSALYPENVQYKKTLGLLYLDRSLYAPFFRLYRDILTRSPRDINAHLQLADAYASLDLKEEEKQILEKARLIDPQNKAILQRLKRLR